MAFVSNKRIKVETPIAGDMLPWRAGPDVARALGMTTETLYPWLDAMGVQRIEIASSKVLVNMPALADALKLWARYERAENLSIEEYEIISRGQRASKAARKSVAQIMGRELLGNEWADWASTIDAYNALDKEEKLRMHKVLAKKLKP